jgi:superfamily I DNA/RNA helicase
MNETWWLNPSQLDDTQRGVLIERPEADLLIVGPPGSGKTNILVLRANYVRSVAPRLLLITFTRTLCEFLRSGPNIGRADQIKKDEITTFMAWAQKFIRENGKKPPEKGTDFTADREAVIQLVQEIIEAQNPGKLYDVVFVDEVQDFRAAELQIMRRLARRINAAGDSRQRIWSHNEGLPTAASMVSRTVTLKEHYRIGAKICDFADQILPPKLGESALAEGCNYDEDARSSSVRAFPCRDLDEEFAQCIARIKEQRRYITDEPIGVLSQSTELRDNFWDVLRADSILGPISILQKQNDYKPFGPDSLVRVMTVASAKGSEFRAVHILGAETFRTNRRELAFTAVTRAKTEVTLYHVAALEGHMRPASDELPELSAIF